MVEIAVIFTAAAIIYGVSRGTDLPEIPLMIVAGAGLAAFGHLPDLEVAGMAVVFPDLLPDREFVLGILEVGLIFLVFVAGMDVSPGRVGEQRGLATMVGLVQFGVLALILGWLALRADYELVEAMYVGVAVSASSTLVVVRQLKNRRELFQPFGRMVLGVLLLQDVLVIAALVLLTAFASETQAGILMPLETTAALVFATAILSRWVMPGLAERYRDDDETLLLIVLGTLFAFVGLSYLGDVPVAVGAFLAGLSLSKFPVRSLVRGLLSSLSDFFVVVFFLSLGVLLEVPGWRAVVEGLVAVVVVLVVTPLLVAFVAEKAGMTSRGALESGLLIGQASEFSLVVALLGLETGQIGEELFAVIVLVTVVTMMITPLWSSEAFVRWLMKFHPSPGPKTTIPDRAGHVVVVGGGTAGTHLVNHFQESDIDVVVVDSDPMVVREFRRRKCDSIWGDGEDEQTLREAGVERARAVIVTTGELHHLRAVDNLADADTQLWFHAFEPVDTDRAQKLGARTINYAEAGIESVMEWFDRELVQR